MSEASPSLSGWTRRTTPGAAVLEGVRVRLEPLDWARHGASLFEAVGGDANADIWTWMPVGPFPAQNELKAFLDHASANENWRTLVILDARDGSTLGCASYMRIREAHGSCEIGCVAFGPRLRRTAEATEALHLMARHVFEDLGYRRYEWKCDSGNDASMRAAARFGFRFEGVFRNDMVVKARSRDTAWFSITDTEWPALAAALKAWLAYDNFATDGSQRATLESFRNR